VVAAQKAGELNGTPQAFQGKTAGDDAVTFENYDDANYGYLRVIATEQQLRIEYHPASDGAAAKTPDDSVTIDLHTRQQTVYTANDLGMPAQAKATRSLLKGTPRRLQRARRAKRGR
jgi:hypothetical protein